MKNKKVLLIIGCIILVIIVGIGYFQPQDHENGSKTTVSTIDSNVNTDDGDEKIIWSDYENREIILTDTIKITEDGIYNLSGTIKDGLIRVNTSGNVKLNLNGVHITNSEGPAIYIENASDVVITISGENYLEDGKTYSTTYTDVDGALFSHDDLTFEGDGTLTIQANYMDGIVSKDDLKFISGTYNIKSEDDGIRGKDSVYILNGNYEIDAAGDGIKTTNDTDAEKGFIKIENGTFKIVSELDGLQAENKLVIENGDFDIMTGGGSSNSSSQNDNWGYWGYGSMSSSIDSESAKGLKAVDNIVITTGKFTLDTSDDSIHSNNYVGISDGDFNIQSGDDGIHADYELIIDGGAIAIDKSYEGIESAKITINNGMIDVISSDDGINIAGGNDSSATNRPGENNYSNSNCILTINNGTIHVDAIGDGIDVNGNAYINGGTITVEGPTNSGNGALDYDRIFAIHGGTVIASGASGMSQSATTDSKQNSVMIYFSNTYSNEDVVTIVDSSNNEIMSYSSEKSYSSLLFSSPSLQSGSSYTVKINGSTYQSFTVDTNCNSVGGQGMENMPGGNVPGVPGGNRGGRR